MRRVIPPAAALGMGMLLLSGCNDSNNNRDAEPIDGRSVFRFETFGNEGFWTDAMQLPQGIAGAGVTPLNALALGLNVNVEALSPGTATALLEALDQVGAGTAPQDTVLGNPAVTLALINEGAVIGVVPFSADGERKPLGSDANFDSSDTLDIAGGDKVGVSCALCHGRTDDSVVPAGFAGPGSVGVPVDGITAEGLDVGAIFAASANPLAYMPFLQLAYDALDGGSLGRGGFTGIRSTDSLEEQTAAARQYLTGSNAMSGLRHYPTASFDSTPDGIGNATYIPPFFRTDLAAPWGSSGSFEQLEDFNNLVYTVALDPTSLLTDTGRAFLSFLAGPVGDEIATRYEAALRATGVIPEGAALDEVIPFVRASATAADAGTFAGPTGLRVDEASLLALTAYTDSLQSPPAPEGLDAAQVALGESIFMGATADGGANCVRCHTLPDEPVENDQIRAITQMYRRYNDSLLTLLDRSDRGITNIQKTLAGPQPEYDLALVVLDASVRGEPVMNPGEKPGYAKPLLLGLDSKDEFLHNGSVEGEDSIDALGKLLDPARGPDAPHPFYFPTVSAAGVPQEGPFLGGGDGSDGRRALVDYLRSRTALPAAAP